MNKGNFELVSTYHTDLEVQFNKEEIINTWEMDWDDDNIYFKVSSDGWITKVNLDTCAVYKYRIDRVAH